ncbi:MAG: hypothetical protein MUC61_03510 [Amoebophilaceae bacterium]|jgi:hypothetical protein|nr:hypothetical protein [Amoebophilaceae bacterium]
MRKQKKLLISALFMLFFFVNVHGKTQRSRLFGGIWRLELERIKLGCKFKYQDAGILLLNLEKQEAISSKLLSRPSFDLFGEYLPDDALGVQLSLGYSGHGGELPGMRHDCDGFRISLEYIMLSAVLRYYPGSSRQLCVFAGYWGSWLAYAEGQHVVDGQEKREAVNLLRLRNASWLRCKKTDRGVLFGLDYELDFGVIAGCYYNLGRERFNESGPLAFFNYSLGFTLGYNFAKLL